MSSTLGTTNSAYPTGKKSMNCSKRLHWGLCYSVPGSAGLCWAMLGGWLGGDSVVLKGLYNHRRLGDLCIVFFSPIVKFLSLLSYRVLSRFTEPTCPGCLSWVQEALLSSLDWHLIGGGEISGEPGMTAQRDKWAIIAERKTSEVVLVNMAASRIRCGGFFRYHGSYCGFCD